MIITHSDCLVHDPKLMELHEVINGLDESLLDELYKVVVRFVSQNDFDYISPEDSELIKKAHEETKAGNCLSFNSVEEMRKYFVEHLGAEIDDED